MMMKSMAVWGAVVALMAGAASAEVKVGVTLGATGPGAALGVPIRNAFEVLPATLGGQPVRYVILDDATDPSAAARHARRLVEEEKVDLLLASSSTPSSTAVAEVARQFEVPQISMSPIAPSAFTGNAWAFSVTQPIGIMMQVVADHMEKGKVKSVAFIGFSDSWGDLVLRGLKQGIEGTDMQVVAEERYGRVDTSVAGQVLRVLAAKPDAIVVGGSGTPGALPHMALRERGFQGPIYHNHGVIGPDFLRVGGRTVEGGFAPTGPVVVAEQLPADHPSREVSLAFQKAYEQRFGQGSHNAFAPYTYDAYLIADAAVAEAAKVAKPGTPEFRRAVRDAIEKTSNLTGSHAVYNMSPEDHIGVDSRGAVLVQVKDGQWRLVP